MFYSQDILQKRGGKFGVVWLAATRAGALSKKDYYSVHVTKSCDDILQHVTLKATVHGVKQRFSLYLSSQLMYGITKVYGKQADYLLVEVQRLHRQFSSTRLLLASLADPDAVDHFQLPKAAIRSVAYCTLPQPDMNQEIFMADWRMTQGVPPQIFEEEFISASIMRGSPGLSFISPDRPISPLEELEDVWDRQHIVSDIGEITLRDDEQPILPDVQVGEMDDLEGLALHGMEEALASIQYPDEEGLMMDGKGDAEVDIKAAGEEKAWTVEEETGKLVLSPIPTRRRSKRLASSGGKAEAASTPVGEPTKPQEKDSSDEGVPEFKTPQSPSGQTVDIPILRLAAIYEEDSTPLVGSKRRKRRRQLVFVDLKTQLSKADMRSNMSDFEDLMEADVLANPTPYPSANDLFKEPARKAAKMSSVLLELWQEGASCSTPRKTDEGDDRVWSTEYLRPLVPRETSSSDEISPERLFPEVPELGRGEFESPEHLREQVSKADDSRASAARMDDTPASLIITDTSKLSESREGSRQGSLIAEQSLQRLRRPEESIEEEGFAAVQGISMDGMVPHPDESLIPEEPELVMQEQGMQSGDWDGKAPEMSTSEDEEKGIPHESIYNQILELTSKQDSTSFQELVPLTTDRKIAAKIFAICLEYAKERLIHFKQSKPYANILIYTARGV